MEIKPNLNSGIGKPYLEIKPNLNPGTAKPYLEIKLNLNTILKKRPNIWVEIKLYEFYKKRWNIFD